LIFLLGIELASFNLEAFNGSYTDISLDDKYLVASKKIIYFKNPNIIATSKGCLPVYDLLLDKKLGYYYTDY